MTRTTLFPLLAAACLLGSCKEEAATEPAPTGLQAFHLDDVQLLPGVFRDAQQTDLEYMLALQPDRLLAPYLREAGLNPKQESYGNWENTGLDGHIGGHYLTALAQMWAATGDPRMASRLNYMLLELKRCQDALGTGYLGGVPGGRAMWEEIEKGTISSGNFELNGKWVPLYNLHKLLAGLRDAYLIGGKAEARELLLGLVDYINGVSNKLSDAQVQTLLVSEHGGINEVFAEVFAITGDAKYLELAKKFSHRKLLNPLSQGIDSLTGMHANTQIPKVVGFQRIAELGGDTLYGDAARFFWETVVENRTVVFGGNSVSEHFNPVDDFSAMLTDIAGPETCNTYNMLKLSRHLFEADHDLKYLEYYERALYNHILASQHPTRGGFVYYTPLRPRHYRVYSQPTQCMWCCVGSGLENHGKYAELIYSHRADEVYVNLFIPSRLSWAETGLIVRQETAFPDQASTELVVEAGSNRPLKLNVRYPSWVASGGLQVTINGETVPVAGSLGSYVTLERHWKKGDRIQVSLPMHLTTEPLPAAPGFVAFLNGPIVLAAPTDTTGLVNLVGDSIQWEGYRARGPLYALEEAPYLKAGIDKPENGLVPVAGKTQTFTAPDLIEPEKYRGLELIPFYKLHDARYMLYWPVGKAMPAQNE